MGLAETVKQECAEIVDLRFTDLIGMWQHFSIPARGLDCLEKGIGFDGSSIAGFQGIEESDMLLFPSNEAFLDPFTKAKTLNVICDVVDPSTGEAYSRDPRTIARKAEAFLKGSGVADTVYIGPELEFYILDSIRFEQGPNFSSYHFDSAEGFWNSGNEAAGNMGHRPGYKKGYFPVPPMDSLQNVRSEMVSILEQSGIPVEVHHHEVGSGGQAEINMRFDSLTRMADKVMAYKYLVKNVAMRNGRTVTFMPKINAQDNGSGMHVNISLWSGGRNIFHQEGMYGDISERAIHFIGGVLEHAPALLAFCAPTTNSYRRLVPGFEAPVNLVYSRRNRSACVRIPMYSPSPATKRIEIRFPDPTANPYLAFAALLMAGLDGIGKKTGPPEPVDRDVYELPEEEKAAVKSTPASLEEALRALEADSAFLLKGGVFTADVIEKWLALKRQEIQDVRSRPHPHEFALYSHI